jgi:hypothetical protein
MRLSVSLIESYIAEGTVHTKLEREVGWSEINVAQRRINGVLRAISNNFQVESNGNEKAEK